jgi:glycosyltransferase involved in cell wall biosynthesis
MNLNKPMLSIVTPSFNQRAFLMEALESVRQQNYGNVEHLVFDGGSTDGSVELLKECSQRPEWAHLKWVSERDGGQSDALNKGFRMASGDLVGWLNSDDRYRPGCFDLIKTAEASAPDIDVFYGDYTSIDEEGRLLEVRREIEFSRFILLYHKVLYVPSTSTFIRRRVFEAGNFLDESFHFAMDYEYFVRLAMKGYKFRHVAGLMADFRWHSSSKSTIGIQKQRQEHDKVVETFSPILKNLRSRPVRRAVLTAVRQIAGLMRYSEKLVRGYYSGQLSRKFAGFSADR